MSQSLSSLAFVSVLILGAVVVMAALPLDAIREYQQSAANHVDVKVVDIKIKPESNSKYHQRVEMSVKVLKVHRSKDKLAIGDVVTVVWSMPKPDAEVVGDWASPPKKASECTAYLSKNDKHFKPAAYSGSFEAK